MDNLFYLLPFIRVEGILFMSVMFRCNDLTVGFLKESLQKYIKLQQQIHFQGKCYADGIIIIFH